MTTFSIDSKENALVTSIFHIFNNIFNTWGETDETLYTYYSPPLKWILRTELNTECRMNWIEWMIFFHPNRRKFFTYFFWKHTTRIQSWMEKLWREERGGGWRLEFETGTDAGLSGMVWHRILSYYGFKEKWMKKCIFCCWNTINNVKSVCVCVCVYTGTYVKLCCVYMNKK